ncbi:MAG: ATP-binding cassette domain-containing protein [Cyanobacteria bacterium SZAS-4]|nr:ATP-binding cassette domain-containing protein [Cyanobacteria bacterium SZAS-4]
MIKFTRVSKTYDDGATYALRDLNLTVANSEFLVLLGSSGSGKSTTMKMINRLIEPSAGAIELDGKPVKEIDLVQLRRSIGYVFQGIGLFPHMSIAENIAIVPRLMGWSKEKQTARVNELLDLINLPGSYAERLPEQLSGGQQQRVGVARALAIDPEYLLMDEPFGALDAVTRDKLQLEMLQWRKTLNKTVIFVTHDLFEALTLGDRIAIFHEGVMQQVGTRSEILRTPATDFVKELFAKPAKQLQEFGDLV